MDAQPHDVAGVITMFEPIEVCGPRRQRLRFLGAEIVPVIDSRNTADHAAAVVQDAFDDVRRDPQRRHAAGHGPAQVVPSKRCDRDTGVQFRNACVELGLARAQTRRSGGGRRCR